MHVKRCRSFMLVIAALLLPAAAGAADPPAGMVMKITGPTNPSLLTRAEIPSNTPVKLEPGSQLTFLHYTKCKIVTVNGGTVTLTRTDFTTDGTVESEKDGPCPRVQQLTGNMVGGTSGALVMRGIPTATRIPVDADIVFTGDRAKKVTGAAVYDEKNPDHALFRLTIADGRATAPITAPPLVPNNRYILKVEVSDQPKPLELGFVGVDPAGDGALMVLRVD